MTPTAQCGGGWQTQGRPEGGHFRGHGGTEQGGGDPQGLPRVVEGNLHPSLIPGLGGRPRRFLLQVAVGALDQAHPLGERLMGLHRLDGGAHRVGRGDRGVPQIAIAFVFARGIGDDPPAIAVEHGHHPVRQVAKIVRQIGVVSPLEPNGTKFAVVAKDHFARQQVARPIHPVALGQRHRLPEQFHRVGHSVARLYRLGALLPAHGPVAVDVQVLEKGDARRL